MKYINKIITIHVHRLCGSPTWTLMAMSEMSGVHGPHGHSGHSDCNVVKRTRLSCLACRHTGDRMCRTLET